MMDTLCLNPTTAAATITATIDVRTPAPSLGTRPRFSFKYPLKSLWPTSVPLRRVPAPATSTSSTYKGLPLDDAVPLAQLEEEEDDVAEEEEEEERSRTRSEDGNWVLKILHVRSLWGGKAEEHVAEISGDANGDDEEEECDCCRIEQEEEEEEEKVEFDRDSFSRLLRKVSLAEARLYAQMSYFGNLAYSIPRIKPQNLLRRYGMRFVTSSIEKKDLAANIEKQQESSAVGDAECTSKKEIEDDKEEKEQKNNGYRISPSAAYHIAASAASYLHSHTKSILPFTPSNNETDHESAEKSRGRDNVVNMMNSDMASLMATTDSVTSVVAAKEEVKQAVADDLNSTHSSPCSWFICDDDQTATRFLVIQGSESLASWQANLLFEPIKFEGLDVLVHRGIYEAAKGIYDQVLPEVQAHLKSHGDKASFRFTGHSLGGSLALLINLMLLIRGEVPISSLLPVVTFGSPSIMCGGDQLLRKLGLARSHIQAITLHRDIVPRAFSCSYPNRVVEILKALNGNFRNHPCLNNQKLLYSPMGEMLILQPDEKFSPNHHLLPSGSGLYVLNSALSDANNTEKLLHAAKLVFLNSPHPLEILSDRSAYGSEGCIQRDHDMNSYLKSVRGVIRLELNIVRKARRQQRRKVWWPLVSSRGVDLGIIVARPFATMKQGQYQVKFSGMLQTGKESLKRFSRLVASQHMHLFVLLLVPARLILLGAYSVMGFS